MHRILGRIDPHILLRLDNPTPIFHAVWRPGGDPALVVWAEDTSEGTRYALPTAEVRHALGDGDIRGHASRLTLNLPCLEGRPLPSTHAENDGEVSVCPVQLGGLSVPPAEAVRVLVELDDALVRAGDDLLFWRTAARFVLELLARERMIPVLGAEADVAIGRWMPLLQGADRARFRSLAEAMPPACRALVVAPDLAASPGELLFEFMAYAVDGLARTWLVERYGGTRPSANAEGPSVVVRSWLSSLTAEHPRAVANPERIRDTLNQWLEPLFETPEALGFRTCLRLRPPREGADDWTLTFLLQSVDDPAELVPSGQVWLQRGQAWERVHHKYRRPQEKLLYDLGLAARVFPPLAKGLKNAHPEMVRLSVHDAYTFLRQAAPALEESDIAVIAPTWWNRRRTGLAWRITVQPLEDADDHVGFDAPVRFQWHVVLGGRPLSPDEFRRLVGLKIPLIRMRHEWIELNPEEAERALRFWEAQRNNGTATLLQALDLASQDAVMGLPVDSVEFEGWLERLATSDVRAVEIEPEGLCGELRPYQRRGVGWMDFMVEHGFGCILADDMGLGKTVEIIGLLLHRKSTGRLRGPILLICPMSVVGNWQHEIARFGSSLRVMIHHGADRLSGEAFLAEARKHDVVVSTYSLVARDVDDLQSTRWEGLVLDEAQNVKNPQTRQRQAVRDIKARSRIALTGTPVENRLLELWSIMDILNPDYLGSEQTFQHRFALPIERGGDARAAGQLRRLAQPFLLRRVKSDPAIVADLPEKMEMKVYCSLTARQTQQYQVAVHDLLRRIDASDGIQRRGLVLAALTRLKQICDYAASAEEDGTLSSAGSGKLLRLEEMLDEMLTEGDQALIFTQFAEFGIRLQRYLEQRLGREVLYLHGGTPRAARDRMIARFQEELRGPPIFLLSLRAGGLGLNLTRANHVFHYDRWWNPAVEDQATDRAFRIGQTRDVQVHKLIAAGTLEDHIDAMIESKRALAEQIVGAGEGWLTELSTAELRSVLGLRGDLAIA